MMQDKIKSWIVMAKAAFSKRKALFSSKVDINVRKKEVNCCIWGIGLYSTGTWILWEVLKHGAGEERIRLVGLIV